MIVHNLDGCAPTPLAHYLKALGILRILAEQVDPGARGWWEGERFKLASKLSRSQLEDFFLERYEPTPIFNPWGGRSGFYSGSSEKSARTVLEIIESNTTPRFDSYRRTVTMVRHTIEGVTGGIKPEGEGGGHLIIGLRHSVRGKAPLWLDSVASIVGSGDRLDIERPALFGTGGNEGSGSYTSAYMMAIDQCLLRRAWDHSLPLVLFGRNNLPQCIWEQTLGQFAPGTAATPWDLLLAFEGACTVRSAVSSRNSTESNRWMSSPFYLAPASYGYPSEARLDEYALKNGKEIAGRGEQWFPLWNQPMMHNELSQMFVEGRATNKRRRAADGWSMVRAVTSFGVRQGIREFIRYGYQQRNNFATHFAVPLGRFRIPEQSSSMLACLDDIENWLFALRKQARAKEASALLRSTERRLLDSLFAVTRHPSEPARWQTVLMSLADVEGVLRLGAGIKTGPVPPLRPEWIKAADDGSPEFRLALSCALQVGRIRSDGAPMDPVRRHWLPLDKNHFAVSGTGNQARIRSNPGVVIAGRKGIDDAIALVQRRVVEAGQRGERRLPLVPAKRAFTFSTDLSSLLSYQVDLDRAVQLALALMAIDSEQWASNPCHLVPPAGKSYPDDAWIAIRLALLPFPLPDDRRFGLDPAIFRRLVSGDVSSAFKIALQRLRAAGVKSSVRFTGAQPQTARLWAAALAFPINQNTAVDFLRRLDADSLKEKTR